MDNVLNHKDIKDQILKALYDNRGGKTLHDAHKIRKNIETPLKHQQISNYLLELIDERLAKVQKGKSNKVEIPSFGINKGKSRTETIPGTDRYYISDIGIQYVENGYKKVETASSFERLVQITEESKEILKQILDQTEISVEDQKAQSQMLMELKEALYDKDDSRARKILKESLDIGKQVAIPLLLEYIKGFAKG